MTEIRVVQDAPPASGRPGALACKRGRKGPAGARAGQDGQPGHRSLRDQRIASSSTSNTSTLWGGILPTPCAP